MRGPTTSAPSAIRRGLDCANNCNGRSEKAVSPTISAIKQRIVIPSVRSVTITCAGYYFAYDMEGNTFVLGPTPALEGTNRITIKDADGKFFLRDMIEAARHGGGSTEYRYPKPGIRPSPRS